MDKASGLVQGVLGGIGMLILVYLLVYNGDNFVKIIDKSGSILNTETKTLQGR